MSRLAASMSLAHTVVKWGSRARRMRPIPAKNSAARNVWVTPAKPSSATGQRRADERDRGLDRLVLPHPDHPPPACAQGGGDALVALAVAADLRLPVVGVAGGHAAVVGASVPVAAVDEDGD